MITREFVEVKGRLKNLESIQDRIIEKVTQLDGKVEVLEEKIDRIEIKVDNLTGMVDKQDYIIKMLENMTAEQAANKSCSDRHEERIEVLEKDVQNIKVAIA